MSLVNKVRAISIDELQQNIRSNYCWDENVLERVGEVTRAYYACESLDDMSTIEAATRFQLKSGTLHSWKKKGTIPSIIKENLVNYQENQNDFSYLLGVYMRSHTRTERRRNVYTRKMPTKEGSKKLKETLERVLQKKVSERKNGQIATRHSIFLPLIQHAYENPKEFVKNDQSRLNFLRGYFNASSLEATDSRTPYRIRIRNIPTRHFVLESLFELNVYPAVSKELLELNGPSLRKFHELNLDNNQKNRDLIDSILLKKNEGVAIEDYYAVRGFLKKGRRFDTSIKELQEEFGFDDHREISKWTADLRVDGKAVKPNEVRKYETICKLLKLPNIFYRRGLIRRNEKAFIAEDGEVRVLFKDINNAKPKIMQRVGYIPVNGEIYKINPILLNNGRNLSVLQKEIYHKLSGNMNSKDLIIKNKQIIDIKRKYSYADHLSIDVEGSKYTVFNHALSRYFSTFGIPHKPIDKAEVDDITKAISDKLEDKQSDYVLDIIRTDVIDISCRQTAGGSRPGIKHTEGKGHDGILGQTGNGY